MTRLTHARESLATAARVATHASRPKKRLETAAHAGYNDSWSGNQATQALLQRSGQPLAPAARGFLETRLGRDLGHVSVHTDAASAASAQALNARAYTLGSHIAFAPGQYRPDTPAGRKLLAHEVAHTLQQADGAAPAGRIQRTIGDGHDLVSPRFSRNFALEAAFDNEREIGTGSAGTHVRLLQQSLLDMGYTLPGFGADGQLGPETEAAIMEFQRDAGAVQVDGIVGDETMGLFDHHDTTRPGGVGPPQRLGPVPGPLPAPSATCDTPYAGVAFALANGTARGVSPAANIFIGDPQGTPALVFEAAAAANYRPEITISAPNGARAREFQVGFAQNLLAERVEYLFSSGTVIQTQLPTPMKDGFPLSSGRYDPVFGSAIPDAGRNATFTGNADTQRLVFRDNFADHAFVRQADNPSCGPGARPGTLLSGVFIDSFRTWVIVRHRPSGCTRALHHMDWDLDVQAIVRMNAGVPSATAVRNQINVTEPNGNGQVPFIQGGRVPGDLLGNNRVCT